MLTYRNLPKSINNLSVSSILFSDKHRSGVCIKTVRTKLDVYKVHSFQLLTSKRPRNYLSCGLKIKFKISHISIHCTT